MASSRAMDIMEKLYQRGLISYPRTETNKFPKTINLHKIVNEMGKNRDFGGFAHRVASGEMWAPPRGGSKDDKAHPPIHPVKSVKEDQLT